MTGAGRVAAVTGASGYLGGRFCDALAADGFAIRRLVRRPDLEAGDRGFDLATGLSSEGLDGVDLLVHCAYDFTARSRSAIWRSNVAGSRALLDAAQAAGVRRTVVVSSMSAYAGTRQLYGRAKLATELDALARSMTVVRPGLVYGPAWGGTAGALRKLASLPVVPLVGASTHQFTVHEDDLCAAIVALANAASPPAVPLGLANPTPVNFRDLLDGLALGATGHHARFVPIPWKGLSVAMRAAELARVPLPLRADSLLGLMRPAPAVEHVELVEAMGVAFRPFDPTS